ncbi:MAG: lipase maturation factor family protein [Thermoanaerobaculia bacterium]
MFEEVMQPRRTFAERWFGDAAPFLLARWLWLRALGLIFFAAFHSLWFQIHGLIGPTGILPARDYLLYAKQAVGAKAYWLIPSLLWIDASRATLTAIVAAGLIASVLLTLNLWPRVMIAIAAICFLSFVAAAQDFSAYQSDGMLLEAAFLSLFLAPRGLRPGRGAHDPLTRAAVFLLQWEWFRIYFESGLVKILSGEEQWRNLTAMDKYYENAPLPTPLAWHVQQWPHAFHAASAAMTLLIELVLVFALFAPRTIRIALFAVATTLQIGIILTGNYAFLNYLVLALGVFLLDDRRAVIESRPIRQSHRVAFFAVIALSVIVLFAPATPPARLIEPFRIVNAYGLFAVMTRARYEIEFQGTRDGKTWVAYPFRYKPQDPREPPRFFAPYHPRLDWNLWFASLGDLSSNPWVLSVQHRLLADDPDVLRLFRRNPFGATPPMAVRAVIWQYWFTTREERARTGAWWNRRYLGEYAPAQSRN